MKIFEIAENIPHNLVGLEKSSFYKFLTAAKKPNVNIAKQVEKIIVTTKKLGDKALINFSNKFDKAQFSKPSDFIVTKDEITKAIKNIEPETLAALKMAHQRIVSYHQKQMPQDLLYKDEQGVKLGNTWRAIESIGVYAPGGTASYPSSILMSALPAIVAGVKQISLCVPSNAQKLSDAVLVAANLCGINKIYKIGGASAIAALAYGTKSIKKVDKIVGPGNEYVATAKKILYGEVGIDMIAGPTDITIICDNFNKPDWVAADALAQLEHGPNSKAFIITNDKKFAQKIIAKINDLKATLPRQNIIDESLKNSAIFIVKNLSQSVNLSNFIAPEHLEIFCKNGADFVPKINNAGAIFLGEYSSESIGDYIAGPSHTLPTEGTAKFASGLSVYDFLKRISLISCDKSSFTKIAKSASTLALCEGLLAHKLSIDIRND